MRGDDPTWMRGDDPTWMRSCDDQGKAVLRIREKNRELQTPIFWAPECPEAVPNSRIGRLAKSVASFKTPYL
jgi:hypothetical protein